ncbi:MAG TPA: NAD(P)-dependent oxidoreductase [Pyrinomonadaceae bacterium]|nr:NAD(P)-dependent oxidoreductase [Pyrinomonadaceae bacterium]
MDLKDCRVVLIGGAGFIGHNLARALNQRGAKVDIIDGLQVNNLLSFASAGAAVENRELYVRIINARLDMLRHSNIPVHVQDARDYHALSHLLTKIKPNVIVHLAAVAHAGRSNKDPLSTFDHSLRTLENALDWARIGIERFVYFSSSMVYGNFLTESVDEEHPLNPIGIYGALKLSGEKIVIAYNQVFDLPYTIVRPSALYGPGCVSRRVGQIFIENAMNGSKLRVEGEGSEKLDFTYIDDLVEGICLAIQNPSGRNQIFNLTNGSSRPISDLLRIIEQHFPQVEVEYVQRDKMMPVRGTLSIDKAAGMLGYAPQNPIEIGFPKYIDWYRMLKEQATPIAAGA